ncbi:hypothetical protein SLS56_004815 [Neofusicoccum ribis]|uniref:non-specific serine/threonine protein kinase n=1 Tax=Neofusicoccum ribis TaxID=45134 RepID=A0ABR3SVE9_9PEZI
MSVPVGGYALGRKPFVDQEKRRLRTAHPDWTKQQLNRTALDAWWSLTNNQRRQHNSRAAGATNPAIRPKPAAKWTAWKVYCSEERLEDYRTALDGKPGLARRGLPHQKLVQRVANQFKRLPAADRAVFDSAATALNQYHGHLPQTPGPSQEELASRLDRLVHMDPAIPIIHPTQDDIARQKRLLPLLAGASWRFKRLLFLGNARVSLYLAVDAAGLVVDRAVVKDSVDPTFPLRAHEHELHAEVWAAAQQQLHGTAILPLHGAHDKGTHAAAGVANTELAFPYCAHGDLRQLTAAHADAGRPIPEPLLWAIFHDLARACRLLATPTTTPSDVLVHTDIKPLNVFLRPHNPHTPLPAGTTWRRALPSAVLADFGSAKRTSAADPHNRAGRFAGGGTPCFVAPELWSADGRATRLRHAVGGAANVYQAGLVMWCLATLAWEPQDVASGKEGGELGPREVVEAAVRRRRADWFPRREWPGWALGAACSARLAVLVEACLDVLPDQRIGVEELCAEVESAVVDLEAEMAGVVVPRAVLPGDAWPVGSRFDAR